jgi:periplasmic copper chaperone A
MTAQRTHRPMALSLAAVLAIGAVACGSTAESSLGGPAVVDALTIEGAWARATPPGATAGVVYLQMASPIDDALSAAAVDATVAASAELHESMTASSGHDMTDHDATDDESGGSEMMTMEPVARIAVPAGERVVLEPGGLHIMLVGLAAPLVAGTELTLTLTFETGGTKTVPVAVRNDAP